MNGEASLTILMNADRKTMTMVKTPTRVLFSLDWTILLERVCRGTGKSWECGGGKDVDYERLGKPARSSLGGDGTRTHPKAAVDSGDEHDGHEDDEAADEEAHHHTGTAGRTHGVVKCTRGTPPAAGARSLPTSQLFNVIWIISRRPSVY